MLSLIRAFFVRDLITDASYKLSFALEILDVIVGAAAFYFLAGVIGDRRPAGYDAFAFILVGVAVNNAMSAALACFSQGVRTDQQCGVLKPLVASVSPSALVWSSAVYPLARAAVSGIVYFAAGAMLGVSLANANLAATALVFALALLTFAAMGLVSAAFTLVLKRGDPLLWLLTGLSWLAGGVLFPVSSLPPLLQHAASALPISYALTALRATLLAGATVRDVQAQVAVLAGGALLGLPLGVWAVASALTWSKRAGTLGGC